jgi:transposase
MPRLSRDKRRALRAHRALHSHPERVQDELFQGDAPFFDPHDLVQVKYEMLRRVEHDKRSVVEAARTFGFSRPVFYQARAAFQAGGLPALQRKRPGPRRRHKLKAEIMEFLRKTRSENPDMGGRKLARVVRKRFGLRVHPRTIERALSEGEKGGSR